MSKTTLKIRLKHSVASTEYSYVPGQEVDAPEEIAKDLVNAGYAEFVAEKSGAKAAERATSTQAATAEKR